MTTTTCSTQTGTSRNETHWLIARLLADDHFRLITYASTKKMIEMFRAEMATPSSALTVTKTVNMLVTGGSKECEEALRVALTGYPELVVTLIPTVLEQENWSPSRSNVCFIGNQILFGIEQIIERGECLLSKYALPNDPTPPINHQFITALRDTVRRLDAPKPRCHSTVSMDFIDAYEQYQLQQMETDGWKSPD